MRGWRLVEHSHIRTFTSRASTAIRQLRLQAHIRPESMAEAMYPDQVHNLTRW